MKRLTSLLILFLIALAVPLTVYIAGQQQELRQHAQETKEPLAPYITIITPSDGSAVSGPTSINVALLNNAQVARVEYYIDGKLSGTVSTPPYNYMWNGVEKLSPGVHSVTARGIDANNNVGTKTIVVNKD